MGKQLHPQRVCRPLHWYLLQQLPLKVALELGTASVRSEELKQLRNGHADHVHRQHALQLRYMATALQALPSPQISACMLPALPHTPWSTPSVKQLECLT